MKYVKRNLETALFYIWEARFCRYPKKILALPIGYLWKKLKNGCDLSCDERG